MLRHCGPQWNQLTGLWQIVRAGQSVTTAVANHTTAQQRARSSSHSATQDHPAYQDAAEACENFRITTQAEYETLVRQWTPGDRLAKAGQTAVIAGLKYRRRRRTPSEEPSGGPTSPACRRKALSKANREHGSIEATHKQCRTHQDLLTRSANARQNS